MFLEYNLALSHRYVLVHDCGKRNSSALFKHLIAASSIINIHSWVSLSCGPQSPEFRCISWLTLGLRIKKNLTHNISITLEFLCSSWIFLYVTGPTDDLISNLRIVPRFQISGQKRLLRENVENLYRLQPKPVWASKCNTVIIVLGYENLVFIYWCILELSGEQCFY